MKIHKNMLDERQEEELLRIEHNGCWMAVWGLAALLLIQQVLFQFEIKYYAGECLLLIVLSCYIMISCVRNGIWDRHLKANVKTNAVISAIAAIISGGAILITKLRGYPEKPYVAIAVGIISTILIFVLCFLTTQMVARVTQKRQNQLEAEDDKFGGEGDEEKGA